MSKEVRKKLEELRSKRVCAFCKGWINREVMVYTYDHFKLLSQRLEDYIDALRNLTPEEEELAILQTGWHLGVTSDYGYCDNKDYRGGLVDDKEAGWPFTHCEDSCPEFQFRPATDFIYLARMWTQRDLEQFKKRVDTLKASTPSP